MPTSGASYVTPRFFHVIRSPFKRQGWRSVSSSLTIFFSPLLNTVHASLPPYALPWCARRRCVFAGKFIFRPPPINPALAVQRNLQLRRTLPPLPLSYPFLRLAGRPVNVALQTHSIDTAPPYQDPPMISLHSSPPQSESIVRLFRRRPLWYVFPSTTPSSKDVDLVRQNGRTPPLAQIAYSPPVRLPLRSSPALKATTLANSSVAVPCPLPELSKW